jgi:hypothetical protein
LRFLISVLVILALSLAPRAVRGAVPGLIPPPAQAAGNAARVSGLLKNIFDEVFELGPQAGEEIVRREFFVGQGDDDTYKDFHLVVLIQDVPGGRKMTLQVARLVPDPDHPRVKYGRDLKSVVCLLKGEGLVLARSDYAEKELASFLPELLRAIRDRKKLIRGRM